ncbi:MAG: hypothetical protein V4514_22325 [Pseudomonadota bacterium]|uniref:hypothetical protein n=1 Tax=Phenylobacterium sp. TaxID=1871053 RepID=UPI0025EEBB28|nr:hypothetical protein [Phenylobacterium sp.]MBT9472740.1 hypothetical protein [Phenylobacterium sp.]
MQRSADQRVSAASISQLFGGLRLWPEAPGTAARAVVAGMLLVTAVIVVADGFLFRETLSPAYVAFFSGPNLAGRIAVLMASAAGEEFTYRLVAMSGLVAGLVLLWRAQGGRLPPSGFLAVIVIVQAINIVPKMQPPSDLADLTYDLMRYLFPGLIWGWLYWRHGWVSALAGHVGTHLFLAPLLLVLLPA